MSDLATADSRHGQKAAWWTTRAGKTLLLAGGILAAVLYAVGNLIAGLLYDGYSFRDQAISELSAYGSPVRPLMVVVIIVSNLLVMGLAVGILMSMDRRSLRGAAKLLLAAGVVGIPNHTIWAMSSRSMEVGFNDTMHQILSSAWVVLVFVAMILVAIAYRGWFRSYSIATIVAFMGFGAAAGLAIRGIGENDTPWAGGFELISAYVYWAWIVVLALTVRNRLSASDDEGRQVSEEVSVTAI